MDDLTREILHFIDRYRAKAAKAGGLTDSNHMLLHAIALDPRGLALPVPKNDFCQPPMVLEEKTGLRGLGVDWKMPAGLRPVELQIYGMLLAHAMECGDLSRAQGQGRMFEACMALTVRNPPLQALRLDGQDVGLLMIRQGLAWHDRRFASPDGSAANVRYAEAQRKARIGGAGLWRLPAASPPWTWRAQHRGRHEPVSGCGRNTRKQAARVPNEN
jgi:hypothetical protein